VESLGRYKLLERLGEGGMAEVFRARLDGPMGFQKDLAIKRIRQSVVEKDEDHARSLINEARIGGRLKHPNVVEVYELGQEDGAYYIAMELVEGVSLRDLLGTKTQVGPRIPPNVLLDIAIQICRGLAYAHSYETEEGEKLAVVHRDVKPSNIMITRNGAVKIMDFGIAKSEGNLFHTTATGTTKGTPLYMSPEQLRGMRPLPASSDLFSVGAILFEMVTGELLFAGSTIPEIINRVLYQPLNADIQIADDQLRGVGDLLKRLLERDVAHREQDAAVVALELDHLLEWQDKTRTTAAFIQTWIRQQNNPEAEHSLEMRQLHEPPVLETTAPGKGNPESETFVSLYVTTRRRRRLGYALFLGILLALTSAAALYIYRSTLVASIANDAGIDAINAGNLAAAEAAWSSALTSNPGHADARYGLVGLGTLGSLGPDGIKQIEDILERVPVHGYSEDARRMRALASAHRAAGDYRQASLLLEAAMGRARQAAQAGGGRVPPALLWEAGELALMREAAKAKFTERARRERARSYFSELASNYPANSISDAAAAYVELIDREAEALLRAELYWRLGDRQRAWDLLPSALQAKGRSADRLQRERLVWIYRALAEGRYAQAGLLLDNLGVLTGEPERRRQAQLARAAVFAAAGRKPEARRKLDAAIKTTKDREVAGVARLQVALALIRNAKSMDWAAGLLEEAAVQIGDDHPDIIKVLGLQKGERDDIIDPETYPGFGSLAYDPRSGRFFPAGLSRGSPSGARLAPASAYIQLNRNNAGRAWPFGPAFHPIDGEPLQVFFHPGK
jgi:serine/threonine protein kinase